MDVTCIFCRGPADRDRVEHILPESLGGKEWACLPPGLVCSGCNQYFGAKVEAGALDSFPFLPFRLLLGIPTKHRKSPRMLTTLGVLRAGHRPGTLGIEPANDRLERGIADGAITQLRILAEPAKPQLVCRLLLKMALELVAVESHSEALSSKFDEAREFARRPRRGQRWWFMTVCDHPRLFQRFRFGVSSAAWIDGVSLSTVEEHGVEVFHLRLLDMSLITPLDPIMQPGGDFLGNEPEWRVFNVSV